MRVNVHGEEFAGELDLIETVIRGGDEKAFGVRFYLASASELMPPQHQDDDRSAITFWQKIPLHADPKNYHERLLLTLKAAVQLIEKKQREQK